MFVNAVLPSMTLHIMSYHLHNQVRPKKLTRISFFWKGHKGTRCNCLANWELVCKPMDSIRSENNERSPPSKMVKKTY